MITALVGHLDNLQPILAEAWLELVSRTVSQEKIDLGVVHWDTTSIYLEGAYEQERPGRLRAQQ